MVLIGLLLAQGLPGELRHWEALSNTLRAFDLTMLIAAVLLIGNGLALLVMGRGFRPALLAGCAAALILAAGLIGGTLTGILPCASPS